MLFLLFVVGFLSPFSSATESFNKHIIQSVNVCEAAEAVSAFRESEFFSTQECQIKSLARIDSNDKMIWVATSFSLGDVKAPHTRPLGLYFSAKAAAEFYLNGYLIGRNGHPSGDAEKETPGVMDTVLYLPSEILKAEHNQLSIKLSSHHNIMRFEPVVQRLIIADYMSPQNMVLRHYLPTFIPFGILFIGFLYSLYLTISRVSMDLQLLLSTFSFAVLVQLILEVSRGVFAYTYPFHDIRMLGILLMSACSGGCLLLYMARKFSINWKITFICISLGLTVAGMSAASALEDKTILAFMVPTGISVCLGIYAAIRHNTGATAHSAALLIFLLAIILKPNEFLDIYFYYFIAALFVFFLILQTYAYKTEQRQRIVEQTRAQRLQLALDDFQQNQAPAKIKLNQAGKIEWVNSEQICYCKGARDYVEIVFSERPNVLYNERLSALENELPSTFLRVHRSYLVNKRYIQSLESAQSGGGVLILTTGEQVPVSRRIMPSVRKVLS
ncbi:LytTR family transcriptional regulator [Pseudoalteromonas sp. SMS1]|uniref:LytR/AlgR family response regulator transcription factor n=1 Tax=Pseudoalteromonas sp. SMS1 TaxID=2908894 RepID=UPI001F3C798E|nr:LytTR family DNA-binding domain-containing protein [Pseudoalteromonas sp. SMS1]MCF2860150.1 LytTR family transcriptional regulator [Pseudoalteromonas sp. SMS1]